MDCGVKTATERKVSSASAGMEKRDRAARQSGSPLQHQIKLQDRISPCAGAPRFSVAGFAVVVAVVAVLSEVVVAVLSEVDVSVSVRIKSVRVRLGSPSASVATETTTVLPDLSMAMCGKGQFRLQCRDRVADATHVGRGFGRRLQRRVRSCSIARTRSGLPILEMYRGSTPRAAASLVEQGEAIRSRSQARHRLLPPSRALI